ncbi:hypothetical protein CLV40_116145 [Actinokineospora auranticolor]|uniref:Uncharacterized protein n=1 Tax=Actinokineospora auranticolor TaxID=155976 RepID=A0A2S6GIP4_9PSEU|nr:hypothetical protein CLV40_116145 [Actinokineospora auranticolor]
MIGRDRVGTPRPLVLPRRNGTHRVGETRKYVDPELQVYRLRPADLDRTAHKDAQPARSNLIHATPEPAPRASRDGSVAAWTVHTGRPPRLEGDLDVAMASHCPVTSGPSSSPYGRCVPGLAACAGESPGSGCGARYRSNMRSKPVSASGLVTAALSATNRRLVPQAAKVA